VPGSSASASLAPLADHLDARRAACLEVWRTRARSDPTQPCVRLALDDAALEDHLPPLLVHMVGALRGASTNGVELEAKRHGEQRRALGYGVGDLVDELMLFRAVLLGVVDDAREAGVPEPAILVGRRVLLDVFDRSLRASLVRWDRVTQAERDAALADLQESHRRLAASSENKDRFLAVLSHELRNPLSPILTAAAALKQFGGDDPRAVRARDIIERQTRQLTRLVDDLLDVSRVGQGKLVLRRERVDVGQLLRVAAETCRPAADAKGVQLEVGPVADDLAVAGDSSRLVQVLTNVVNNAVKFTPKDGRVGIGAAAEGDEVVLRVRDTGVGIDAATLPRIFELFWQAPGSGARGGLGIGLMLARTLTELQGGRIAAHSEGAGKGTEIVIRLPRAGAAATADAGQ
jgi:signal transduction histidine kinase